MALGGFGAGEFDFLAWVEGGVASVNAPREEGRKDAEGGVARVCGEWVGVGTGGFGGDVGKCVEVVYDVAEDAAVVGECGGALY